MLQPHTQCSARTQEENLALEYILLGDLRDLMEQPLNNEIRRWLLAVLGALLDTLPNDSSDGDEEYLGEVLQEFPNWSRSVDELHRQREDLFGNLGRFRDQVLQGRDLNPIAPRLQDGLREWMVSLTAYKRHEARMLQMAYTLEVGVGD